MVLNVGDQCISSVFKNPLNKENKWSNKIIQKMWEGQDRFDSGPRKMIHVFLASGVLIFIAMTVAAILLSKINFFASASTFISEVDNTSLAIEAEMGIGIFLMLLSIMPLSFNCIIEIIVLIHAKYTEWDVNLVPA